MEKKQKNTETILQATAITVAIVGFISIYYVLKKGA